jgi:SAM-dependent methyltransferase
VRSSAAYGALTRWRGRPTLNYGRDIVGSWARRAPGSAVVEVLDLGCGAGTDLRNIAECALPRQTHLHGVDVLARVLDLAKESGVSDVRGLDIEHQRLPFADATFDYVVANQVLEHTKEIFWIVAEVVRVLKPDGLFCVGVPNLASFHNRVLIMLGQEPTTARIAGPHVRTFTRPGLTQFLELGGYLCVIDLAGSNFYPFPPRIARHVARAWPTGAVSLFLLSRRTRKKGTFLEALGPELDATPFVTTPAADGQR